MSTSIIVSPPQKTYESWREVPSDCKTRSRWLRAGRKVPKHEKPTARVVYPRIIEGMTTFGLDTVILDETDDFTIISDAPTPLFHLNQTVPYTATQRTLAYWAFEDIFFKHARKDCWIHKTDLETGDELEDWSTESEYEYVDSPHLRNRLSTALIRKHINQRQIIGVKGGDLTRFILIDLDFHGRNLKVFESQAEVLLDRFHGVGTWHYQVKRQNVTGIHFICVFEEPRALEAETNELRGILVELDGQHPELAAEAKAAGMKSLAELEIYPTQDNGNGVRLPLCLDREMLLDKPLPLVMYQKKLVQDVEGYVRWLQDPDRKHMPKERVRDYLHYFAWENGSPVKKAPVKRDSERVGEIDQKRWRRNMRRWLYEFWIEGKANNRLLNEHIVVLARLAATQGYSESDIRQRIGAMIRQLPDCAKSCSSRLLKGEYRKIDNTIRSTARYACDKNSHQPDAKASTEILSAALTCWPDFDALDKSTWTAPTEKVTVTPNWTDEQRRRLCAFFRKPLFVKDDGLIIRFINAVVNLTIAKEREGHGWGKEYLLKWMNDQFPGIKCAKDEKRQRIMRCLEDEGIIQALYRGRAGMYATHWTLGAVAKQALGITSDVPDGETPSISPTAPKATLDTSTYYSSLFSDAAVLESGCTTAEPVISVLSQAGYGRQVSEDVDNLRTTPELVNQSSVSRTGCRTRKTGPCEAGCY